MAPNLGLTVIPAVSVRTPSENLLAVRTVGWPPRKERFHATTR